MKSSKKVDVERIELKRLRDERAALLAHPELLLAITKNALSLPGPLVHDARRQLQSVEGHTAEAVKQ